MAVVDLIDELPRADWTFGQSSKTSVTVHWNGTPVPESVADIDIVFGDASYHMSKDWSDAVGVQQGDGIMYHRLYGRDGTVYLTRRTADWLWHSGDPDGNRNSEAWQVMSGKGQNATPAQLESLARDLVADGRPRRGHREWPLAASSCPGDALVAFIHSDLKEDDLTPEQDARLKKIEMQLDGLVQQQTALARNIPTVWLARLFWAINPATGKRRGVETQPADIEVK